MAAGEREVRKGTIADSIAIARGSLRNPGRALKSGLRGLPHIRKKTRMCGVPAIRARLFVFVAVGSATATMGRATTRGCGMGGATGRVVVRGCGMGITHGATAVVSAIAPGAYGPWPTSAIGCIRASTAVSTAGDISASSPAIEAVITPAVAIAPARPWTHAQEDAVIEIARPIKSAGCAAIRCIVVVAV